jgi:alkanesulfonate monooxygenase SsuD/methylene tetrahydromethanopterin reductase-like flavin-dependent oxidoreductase (luciferase family)
MPATSGLHLGVSLSGAGHHPAAWRTADAPAAQFRARYVAELAQEAERGRLDFVVFEDSFDRPPAGAGQRGGCLDALLVAARVAPVTTSIGLIPVVTTTHTEPFHVSKNVATLDFVSLGRAGWKVAVSTTEADARRFGRKAAAALDELYAEASEAIDVVARLWDSWEDDAVIRDQPTGRYIDRDKVHYIDFDGRFFQVRGPSITPRSPQGHPLVAIDATVPAARELAAHRADLAFIEPADPVMARSARDEIRAAAVAAGRDEDAVTVLATIDVLLAIDDRTARAERAALDADAGADADVAAPGALDFVGTPAGLAALIEDWYRAGVVDGFVIRPALLPRGLTQVVSEVVPVLQDRGVFRRTYEGPTLRDIFRRPRPENRYASVHA